MRVLTPSPSAQDSGAAHTVRPSPRARVATAATVVIALDRADVVAALRRCDSSRVMADVLAEAESALAAQTE
jgi:hypothetical protein